MIFTNHRSMKLRIPEALYQERQSRLAKFIQLKAPPVIIKHAAQLLTASFRWSWRGLLGDVWLWIQYSRPGWWMQWLLSKEFRRETDAAGLEMMELLDEPEEARAERLAANEPYTMLYKLNPEAEAPSDVVTDLGEYHENAFTSIPQQQPVSGSLLTPHLQPGQRRRFAEPWDAWRKRVREKAAK